MGMERVVDLIERRLLMWVEHVRSADASTGGMNRLDRQTDEAVARESPRGDAGFRNQGFELRQVVRSGMQLQVREQLALRFGKFYRLGTREKFGAQTLGGGPQRVAFGSDVFGDNEL